LTRGERGKNTKKRLGFRLGVRKDEERRK
jgi:hypothetical protein